MRPDLQIKDQPRPYTTLIDFANKTKIIPHVHEVLQNETSFLELKINIQN